MWTEKKCKLYNFGTDGVEEKYIGCSRYLVHGPWAVASGPRTYLANIKVRTAPLSPAIGSSSPCLQVLCVRSGVPLTHFNPHSQLLAAYSFSRPELYPIPHRNHSTTCAYFWWYWSDLRPFLMALWSDPHSLYIISSVLLTHVSLYFRVLPCWWWENMVCFFYKL